MASSAGLQGVVLEQDEFEGGGGIAAAAWPEDGDPTGLRERAGALAPGDSAMGRERCFGEKSG